MTEVKSKYPAIAALLSLFGTFAEDVSSSGSLLQKLANLSNLIPGAVTLEGLASDLGPEFSAIKALPLAESISVFEGCAELLVTDLAFSSSQAQAAQKAAFALGEWLVAGVPAIEAIIALKKA
jgi:hypothetical protein